MNQKTLVSTIAVIGAMIGGVVIFQSLPLSMDRIPLVLAETAVQGEQEPEGGDVTSRAVSLQESIFLKIGNIKGQTQTKGFEDSIVIHDFAYQISQGGQWDEAGQRPSGRVTSFGDITLDKFADRSSPSLAQACAVKEQIPKAELFLFSGRDVYMKVTLEGVIITSVKIDFDPASLRPKETFTLSYRKATWEWGTAKASYDLRQNAKV